MNKKIAVLSSLVLGLAVVMPVFAGTSASATTSTVPAPSNAGAAIACAGAAVNAREAAIDAAMATHTQAVTTAYAARATALNHAYSLKGLSDVREASRAAWKAFNASIRGAAKDWKTAQRAAWSAFGTASKACRPAGISDSGNSWSEISGR